MPTLELDKFVIAGVQEEISDPGTVDTFSFTQGSTFWVQANHSGTINFTNVPKRNRITTFTIIAPTGVFSAPTTVNVNGTPVTVRWASGAPTNSGLKLEVWVFSIILKLPNTSGITSAVLGAMTQFT